jgi:hypothetical protein
MNTIFKTIDSYPIPYVPDEMQVFLVNSDGKSVLIKSFTTKIEGSIPVVAGIYDPRKLMDLFPSVIEEVCFQFVSEFSQ